MDEQDKIRTIPKGAIFHFTISQNLSFKPMIDLFVFIFTNHVCVFENKIFHNPPSTKKIPKIQIKFCDSPYLKMLAKSAQITFVKFIIITIPVFVDIFMDPMKK